MAGQGKLFKFFTAFGNYRNVVNNRATATSCYLQNAGVKTNAKDKLKSLSVPVAPKRPLSAYFKYLTVQRTTLVKQHPEWKIQEITRQCGVDWKNVDPEIKKKYKEEYTEELAAYKKDYEKFTSSLTEEQLAALTAARKETRQNKQDRKIKKLNRETNKPKRPRGSFIYFITEQMALPENKNKKLIDVLKENKSAWGALSTEEKNKYKQMQQDDKDRYDKEMLAWESKMIEEGRADIIRKESRIIIESKPSHLGDAADVEPKTSPSTSSKQKKVR